MSNTCENPAGCDNSIDNSYVEVEHKVNPSTNYGYMVSNGSMKLCRECAIEAGLLKETVSGDHLGFYNGENDE